MTDDESPDSDSERYAVVLDVLHHGRTDGVRSRFDPPIAFAVDEEDFTLYEVSLADDADISIDDRIRVQPDFEEGVKRGHTVDYDDLTDGARSELDYVVEEIVEANERQFVDFYNDAQAVSLRQHQLDLVPGIGSTLRDKILDERKRGPFESFEDLDERVSGLHNPKEVVVERILSEIKDGDVKYHLFVRS
ncbi:DUF655 domain-containing protein [Halospeciosus flavus]|uniref:DUF655 domain-containing protein n=1 Tax=Halospeciosus flavus TaxID=3032283 RepID=A0ABD5Z266_9EURY|nr:DUF655 domain-containing protein [Halospeciosus flavus]